MGAVKWLGGLFGWITAGPIGALLGFIVGSVADASIDMSKRIGDGSGNERGGGYSGSGPQGGSSSRYARGAQASRSSFLMSLLVLSTAVIKADGRYLKSELDYVREFIRRSFGEDAVPEAMSILKDLRDKDINVYQVGAQIGMNMNYSQRLQLLHYLVDLAGADGSVREDELGVLRAAASAMGISSPDVDSILAMFERNSESAYKVLEISPDATDEQVKKAYKRLAMKNHPDKVASLGPDVQKAAEEKFKKIQAAYETIKKERNIS